LFSEAWAKYETGLSEGKILGFQGSFKENKGSLSFAASSVYGDVSQMKPVRPSILFIEVVQDEICPDFVRKVRNLVVFRPGQISIKFSIYRTREQMEGDEVGRIGPKVIAASKRFRVDLSGKLLEELRALDGVADVYVE